MLIAGFLGCQPVLIISLLFIAFSFDAFTTSGFKSNHNELSPEFSGILFGITNTIGNFPGFIGPMIAGSILDSNTGITGWKMVFSLGSIVYLGKNCQNQVVHQRSIAVDCGDRNTCPKTDFDKIKKVGNVAFLMFSQFTVQEWN